jgi:hypothetical protein
MNPRIENLKVFLATGATLYSVGQLDAHERAWLNHKVRCGKLIRYEDPNRYPKPCAAYYLPFGVNL